MRNTLPLLALLALSACMHTPDLEFREISPYTKLCPDAQLETLYRSKPEAAKGTHVEWQFAIRPSADLSDVRIEVKGLKGIEAELGLVGYVGISTPTADIGDDVIVSPTGLYPDPIYTEIPTKMAAESLYCLWLSAYIPQNAKAGDYRGSVVLTGRQNGKKFKISHFLDLEVYDVSMPEPTFSSVNWAFDSPSLLNLWNGGKSVERYSEDYWLYVRQMAQALKGAYQSTIQIPTLDLIEQGPDGFDFGNFDKWVSILRDFGGLRQLQGDELGRRAAPVWDCPDFALYVPSDSAKLLLGIDDPRTVDFYTRFLPAYTQHIKDLGLYDNFVQRLCDEPTDANAEGYRKVAEFVKEIAPDLKIIEALQTTHLDGVVDVQVPQLDIWHKNYYDFAAMDGPVWFYTCCMPRGEYPNRFIEQPLLKTRALYWLAFEYGADGYLHWGFNYWNDAPYSRTDVPGAGIYLPGGDSWLVYPGNRSFVKSLRYNAVRDGIEDYTLLEMLEARDSARAHQISRMVVKDWLNCGKDEAAFTSARHLLLEALGE